MMFGLMGKEESDLCHPLRQSTDAGDVIWNIGLRAAADPGHLLLGSFTGQCVMLTFSI